MNESFAATAADTLARGIGRRDFVRAVAAVGAGAGITAVAAACGTGDTPAATGATSGRFEILQPDHGDIAGDHYLRSTPD